MAVDPEGHDIGGMIELVLANGTLSVLICNKNKYANKIGVMYFPKERREKEQEETQEGERGAQGGDSTGGSPKKRK